MTYDQTAAIAMLYVLIGIYQAMRYLLDNKTNPTLTKTACVFVCWPLVVIFKATERMMP